jgi:hypothetical protein
MLSLRRKVLRAARVHHRSRVARIHRQGSPADLGRRLGGTASSWPFRKLQIGTDRPAPARTAAAVGPYLGGGGGGVRQVRDLLREAPRHEAEHAQGDDGHCGHRRPRRRHRVRVALRAHCRAPRSGFAGSKAGRDACRGFGAGCNAARAARGRPAATLSEERVWCETPAAWLRRSPSRSSRT